MLDIKENVARLLKPIWVCNGVVSSAAFSLRPHIHETYISVLRETVDSFSDDAQKVSKNSSITYASMNVGELGCHKVEGIEDKVAFDVTETDNASLKSHAGIFISINNQMLVGGEPFESIELKRGKSADDVLLIIRKSLARFASNRVKTIE